MVSRVSVTVQHRDRSASQTSVQLTIEELNEPKLLRSHSLSDDVHYLQLLDGSWHPASKAADVFVTCISGILFGRRQMGLEGGRFHLEGATGTCSTLEDARGVAVAASAAMFIAFNRTDLLTEKMLDEWYVLTFTREEVADHVDDRNATTTGSENGPGPKLTSGTEE